MNYKVAFCTLCLLEVKQVRSYNKNVKRFLWRPSIFNNHGKYSQYSIPCSVAYEAYSHYYVVLRPSTASCKLSSLHNAIWCFVLQIPVSPFLLRFTQLLLTSSFSSIVISKIGECNHSFSLKSIFGFLILVSTKILIYYTSTLFLVLLSSSSSILRSIEPVPNTLLSIRFISAPQFRGSENLPFLKLVQFFIICLHTARFPTYTGFVRLLEVLWEVNEGSLHVENAPVCPSVHLSVT